MRRGKDDSDEGIEIGRGERSTRPHLLPTGPPVPPPFPPLLPPGLVNGIVNSTRGFIEIFPERVDS